MKRNLLVSVFISLLSITVSAQTVGLVLSGGGAKGAAHLGVIKALEENNIPIDYITGTSVGAIVGGMYAMAWTPEEVLDLMLSEEFSYWQSGKVQQKYIYFFKEAPPTPEFMTFHIQLGDSVKILNSLLPSSLINPIQMNQAFMGLFAQATAQCGGDFNKLFVPFRCVASDVFDKKAVVFSSGSLGDAVRASMTFPFVFKPLTINGVPMFDGGIYDNFPIDCMKEDFKPGFILGVSLSGENINPSKSNLYEQVEAMIMQKTDYQVDSISGILLQIDLPDVNLLDFQKSRETFKIGYDKAMQMMPEIKKRVKRTRPAQELALMRMQYRNQLHPLRFKDVIVEGCSEQQARYIEHQFTESKDKYFSFEDFKRIYFQILTDSKIKEIIPHAVYNPDDDSFNLILKVTISNEIAVSFGGNISSSSANQLYLGIGYQTLGRYPFDAWGNFQVGNAFSGVLLTGRVDMNGAVPMYLRLTGAFSLRNYFEKETLFFEDLRPSFIRSKELYVKASLGFPFLTTTKAEITAGFGRLTDRYYPTTEISATSRYDKSYYNQFLGSLRIINNTLNYKQYPTLGTFNELLAQSVTSWDNFEPGTVTPGNQPLASSQSWLQFTARINNYHSLAKHFTLGYLFEGVLSSKNLSENYTSSIIQAPAFTPTPHSKITYHEAFRSNQYIAGGLIPIVKFTEMLHLRTEVYGFVPIYPISRVGYNDVTYGKAFSKINFMGEIAAVVQLPFASISVFANTYSYPFNRWNFGLNIGYLIFNPKFLD
ncbi:MAG: patatin-like phospholipase family protein [Bacteroidales bacterium]|nr:patatin-like phospholipase family protein [Bacteroidales bacterium]